jgi:PAS domain S-box-containing protein
LSKKLAVQTHVANEVENRFRNMADLAPTGMFHIDPEGILVYANNEYYMLTGHPRNVSTPMSWYNVLLEDDHALMDSQWGKLIAGEEVNFEIRLKRPFVTEELFGGEKITGPTWIIAAAYAEKSAEGEVTGILGCLTDISRVKWAEGFQNRKMLEAVELKQQQENFIDMTSQ